MDLITGMLTTSIAVTVSGDAYPHGTVPVFDYVQTSTGNLHMEIRNYTYADHDSLVTTNTITCDGALTVTLASGYTPTDGHAFQLLNPGGGSILGSFDLINVPDLSASGLSWDLSTIEIDGTLSIRSESLMAFSLHAVPKPTGAAVLVCSGGFALRRRRLPSPAEPR